MNATTINNSCHVYSKVNVGASNIQREVSIFNIQYPKRSFNIQYPTTKIMQNKKIKSNVKDQKLLIVSKFEK